MEFAQHWQDRAKFIDQRFENSILLNIKKFMSWCNCRRKNRHASACHTYHQFSCDVCAVAGKKRRTLKVKYLT